MGGALFSRLEADGDRSWQCTGGKLVDPNEVDAEVVMVGDAHAGRWDGAAWTGAATPGGWVVDAGYAPGSTVARLSIADSVAAKNYTLDLDSTPVLDAAAPNGTLPDARWTATWVGEGPPGTEDASFYIIRTNITGGDTPTKCASAAAGSVDSPYTATYLIYACPKGAASGAVAVSAWTAVAAVVAALGAFL